jgi:ABC-type lipoprotein release transport system permease subunit
MPCTCKGWGSEVDPRPNPQIKTVRGSFVCPETPVHAFLFDVSATDPLVYSVAALSMLLLALLASALPAARAASADPVDALRAH